MCLYTLSVTCIIYQPPKTTLARAASHLCGVDAIQFTILDPQINHHCRGAIQHDYTPSYSYLVIFNQGNYTSHISRIVFALQAPC